MQLVEEVDCAEHHDDRQTSDDHGSERKRPTPVIIVHLPMMHDGVAPPVVNDHAIQAHEHCRGKQNERDER